MTRLRVAQLAKLDNDSSRGTPHRGTAVDSDEWLTAMLAEYGDDIDTLRTTAKDFSTESVAIIAQLLRESQNVFEEV